MSYLNLHFTDYYEDEYIFLSLLAFFFFLLILVSSFLVPPSVSGCLFLIDLYDCFLYVLHINSLCVIHMAQEETKMLHNKGCKGHQVKKLLSEMISEVF